MAETTRTPIVLRPNAEASHCYTCAKASGIERARTKEGIAACEHYGITFVPIGAGHSWDYVTRYKQELTFVQCRSCFDKAQAKRMAPKERKARASSSGVAPADLAAMIAAAVAQALGQAPAAPAVVQAPAAPAAAPSVPPASPAKRGAIAAAQDAKLEEQRAAIRRAMDAGVLTAQEGAEKLSRLA